jgi:hypothetical protein
MYQIGGGASAGPGDVGADEPARADESTLRKQGAPSLRCPTSLPPLWPQAIRPPSPATCSREPWVLRQAMSSRCRSVESHPLVHRVGNEAAWWKDASIDPAKAARKLWNDSAWIRGGSRPDRRHNVPRQIEPLTSTVRLRTARRQPDLDSADPRGLDLQTWASALTVPVDRPAAVGLRSITSDRLQRMCAISTGSATASWRWQLIRYV